MTAHRTPEIDAEGRALAAYLLGREAGGDTLVRYATAVERLDHPESNADRRLLDRLRRRPALWPLVDAGLALVRPRSHVRRRVVVMLAMLEADPSYADLFLPVERKRSHAFVVGLRMVAAMLRGAIGSVIVLAAGR